MGEQSYSVFAVLLLQLSVLFVAQAQDDLTYRGTFERLGRISAMSKNSIMDLSSLGVPTDLSMYNLIEEATEDIEKAMSRPAVLPTESSELCFNQTLYTLENMAGFGLHMVDAMGKLPSGFFAGDLLWLGNYDECISIQSGGSENMDFSGKHCLATAGVTLGGQPAALRIGVCFPGGCHAEDVRGIIDSGPVILSSILRLNLTSLQGISVVCHEPKVLDGKAIATILICSISITLVLLGSIYDIYKSTDLRKTEKTFSMVPSQTTSPRTSESGGTINERPQVNSGVNHHDHGVEDAERAEVVKGTDDDVPLLNGLGNGSEDFSKTVGEKKPDHGILGKILMAFSAITNTTKMMSTAQPKGALTCIHGIRVFSILWVVLGHTFVFSMSSIKNMTWIGELLGRPSFGVIENATVSVDSFFVMSGLLFTYLTLRELEKRKGKFGVKGWIMIYVHRYIRLTPVYMLLLMVWSCLVWYFGDGPLWPTTGTMDAFCSDNWWTNLLYINNFWGLKNECFAWSWYLANDMQFFIIAVPIIYLLYRFPRVGLAVTASLTCGSVITAMVVVGVKGIGLSFQDMLLNPEWGDAYYAAPWCRFQTYGIGMLTGYFLFKCKCKLDIQWTTNLLMWAVAATLCLVPLYGPYEMESGHQASTFVAGSFYHGMSRSSWGLGLAWVIVACCTGNGGYINQFLSWKPFVPLGRLAYCVYLTNCIVIEFYSSYAREPVTFNNFHITMVFFSTIIFNYLAAYVASILWEGPTMNIEKLIFKR